MADGFKTKETGIPLEEILPVCPFLKKRGDQTVRYGFPHASNCCFKPVMAQPVKLGYQKSVCLTNTYCTACVTYQTVAPLSLPPKALGTLPAPQQKKKRSKVALYAAVPAVLVAGFFLVRLLLPKEQAVEAVQTAVVFTSPAEAPVQDGVEASVIVNEEEAKIPVTGLMVTTPASQPDLVMERIVIAGDDSLGNFHLSVLPGWEATPLDPDGHSENLKEIKLIKLIGNQVVVLGGSSPEYLELP